MFKVQRIKFSLNFGQSDLATTFSPFIDFIFVQYGSDLYLPPKCDDTFEHVSPDSGVRTVRTGTVTLYRSYQYESHDGTNYSTITVGNLVHAQS
jgi:hypothetical protein